MSYEDVAEATAKALAPVPTCHRTGIHMVELDSHKCAFCGELREVGDA